MNKNVDENIVVDEQKKANEQSKQKMPREKVKRVVLAVLLLILAVAFVVLGAFCATGFFDILSAPAVCSATYDFDNSNSYFDLSARKFFGFDTQNVSPSFNAFLVVDNFSSWLFDWSLPISNGKSFITFYNTKTDRKVADLLMSCDDEYSVTISLRIFANDKLSSFSTLRMFECYVLADDITVRTFTDTYCFGYNSNDMVYAKLNDDCIDDLWAIEFTEMMFLCSDVSNSVEYKILENEYNILENEYNILDYEFDDLTNRYNGLMSSHVFSYIPIELTISGFRILPRTWIDFNSDNFELFEVVSSVDIIDLVSFDCAKCIDDFAIIRDSIDTFDCDCYWGKILDSSTFNGNYYYQNNGFHYLAFSHKGDYDSLTILAQIFEPNEFLEYGYNRYQYGYHNGYDIGYTGAITDTDTVVNGVIDVIESPVEFLKSVFNFEIFGINISSVIFFILSVIIVAFVIKKVV